MIKQLADVSLKSLDMINKNAEGINKLAEFLHDTQKQLNTLATKVLELEQRLNVANKGIERIDEQRKN
jgi:BMFP domain-containing protein YqiC